jgi:hypothetical protein
MAAFEVEGRIIWDPRWSWRPLPWAPLSADIDDRTARRIDEVEGLWRCF